MDPLAEVATLLTDPRPAVLERCAALLAQCSAPQPRSQLDRIRRLAEHAASFYCGCIQCSAEPRGYGVRGEPVGAEPSSRTLVEG